MTRPRILGRNTMEIPKLDQLMNELEQVSQLASPTQRFIGCAELRDSIEKSRPLFFDKDVDHALKICGAMMSKDFPKSGIPEKLAEIGRKSMSDTRVGVIFNKFRLPGGLTIEHREDRTVSHTQLWRRRFGVLAREMIIDFHVRQAGSGKNVELHEIASSQNIRFLKSLINS